MKKDEGKDQEKDVEAPAELSALIEPPRPKTGFPPARTVMTLAFGGAAAIFAIGICAFFFRTRTDQVSQAELDRLAEDFPKAVTRLVQEKKDAKVNRIEVKDRKVSVEGLVRLTYVLSFEEAAEDGQSVTNTVEQVAVLQRAGETWKIVGVDARGQDLSFQTGMTIDTDAKKDREPAREE